MASSSSSGLTFKLHPLVILNISDHYTRVKSQSHSSAAASDGADSSPPPPPRVLGCVIGVQRGRTVEIFNSFELLYDPSTHSLDRPFLEKKQELCQFFLSPKIKLLHCHDYLKFVFFWPRTVIYGWGTAPTVYISCWKIVELKISSWTTACENLNFSFARSDVCVWLINLKTTFADIRTPKLLFSASATT